MPKTKILVVESDATIASDIKKSLRNLGYSVTSIVPTAKEALSLIKSKKHNPNLVLIDIDLKGKSTAIKSARQIRARFDIPIVYISEYSDRETLDAAKKTEPFGYILKPIYEKQLHITIEIALHKHASEKELKKACQTSEERFHQLVEHMNEAVIVLDENSLITYMNNKFLEKSPYTKDKLIGHSPTEFLDKPHIDNFKKQQARRKKGLSETYELEIKSRANQKVLLLVSAAPLHDEEGRFKGTIGVISDITEQRRFQQELDRSREELQRLSRHLHCLRERESQRIAREIHDELGQALTVLKMELSWLYNKFPEYHKNKKRFLEKTTSMSKLIDKTIQKVQKIASELRPEVLDDLGLVPAIEWQARDFKNRTKIKCKMDLNSLDVDLSPECSTAIFRILQEALTNVARHAKATWVKISLKKKEGKLDMIIKDNGKGIAESDISSPDSFGLIGMRERIRTFGGELELHGIPDKGTTLSITLPIDKFQAKEDTNR